MTVWLGKLGNLHELKWTTSASRTEPSEVETVRTGAGVFAMAPRYRQPRTWGLEFGGHRPHEVQALVHLWRYAHETAPWTFVSEHASNTNGLTPAQSALRGLSLPWGVTVGASTQATDMHGKYIPVQSLVVDRTDHWILDEAGPPVPVIPKQSVTVSAAFLEGDAMKAAPGIGVQFYGPNGYPLSDHLYVRDAPAWLSVLPDALVLRDPMIMWETMPGGSEGLLSEPPLTRRWATFRAPWNAASCRLVLRGGTQVVAPAITLTAELSEWGEGDGAPEVVPSGDLGMRGITGRPGYTHSAFDAELQEVGVALR